MPLFYALVSRGSIVLCEHTPRRCERFLDGCRRGARAPLSPAALLLAVRHARGRRHASALAARAPPRLPPPTYLSPCAVAACPRAHAPACSGNFNTVTRVLLGKISPTADAKMSYIYVRLELDENAGPAPTRPGMAWRARPPLLRARRRRAATKRTPGARSSLPPHRRMTTCSTTWWRTA